MIQKPDRTTDQNSRQQWLRIDPMAGLVYSLHLLVLLLLFVSPVAKVELSFQTFLNAVLLPAIAIVAQVQLIKSCALGHRVFSILFSLLYLIVFLVLSVYYLFQHVPFDVSLLLQNDQLLLYFSSWDAIFGTLSVEYIPVLFLFWTVIGWGEWRYHLLSRGPVSGWSAVRQLGVSISVLLCVSGVTVFLYQPGAPFDPISNLQHSTLSYLQGSPAESSVRSRDTYPYVRSAGKEISYNNDKSDNIPNVFLIFMESFSQKYVRKKAPNGQEITPFLNSKIPEGVYASRFYANSVQTPRGQVSTLAGILPSYREMIFNSFPDLRLKALPKILAHNGYKTMYYQAYPDLSFYNTGHSLQKLGYDIVESVNEESLQRGAESKFTEWGVQDDVFYKHVFDVIDRRRSEMDSDVRPLFVTLLTGAHHWPFDYYKFHSGNIYSEPENRFEHYLNSLHQADRFLRTFFEELHKREYLENSMVIIMGDHSWPTGEHGYWSNETRFYEEFYRVPFLLLWPGEVTPRTIRDVSFSQVDVPVTILDALNIRTRHHFIGDSMLQPQQPQRTIYQIQPYAGGYLGVVQYPFKYVYHLKSEQSFLFNLEEDPGEERNIVSEYEGIRDRMHRKLKTIYRNQKLIEENRIWPAEEEEPNQQKGTQE